VCEDGTILLPGTYGYDTAPCSTDLCHCTQVYAISVEKDPYSRLAQSIGESAAV